MRAKPGARPPTRSGRTGTGKTGGGGTKTGRTVRAAVAKPSPRTAAAKAPRSGVRVRPTKTTRSSSRADTGGGPSKRAVRMGRPGLPLSRVLNARTLKALLIVLVCGVVGGSLGAGAKALWTWVTHSPRFAIRELAVTTGPRVSEEEVKMLADLEIGDNIIGFRLADCVEAIEIHPWVRRASVMRELPDRVAIEITEREPAAIASLGALYYVDAEGEIFKKVLPGESMDYPVITGLTLRDAVENKAEVDGLIQLGFEVMRRARGSRILPAEAVSEINLDRTYGVTVARDADGMRIVFGRGDYEKKFFRLERTLVELGDEAAKVAELDLNCESRTTVRLREGYEVAAAGPKAEPPEKL